MVAYYEGIPVLFNENALNQDNLSAYIRIITVVLRDFRAKCIDKSNSCGNLLNEYPRTVSCTRVGGSKQLQTKGQHNLLN